MGSRYESTKNEVSKVHEKSEEIAHSQQKLHKEFSLLSTIDTILQNADSETVAVVQTVSEVGEAKADELSNEHQENETEKTELSDEINAHLEKLFSGLEIISKPKEIKFGQEALEEAKEKYNQQIALYKELLGELGMDATSSECSGGASAGAEIFTETNDSSKEYDSSKEHESVHSTYNESLHTEEYFVQGVSQSQINQLRGTRGHQANYTITWKDIKQDYARVGIKISNKKAKEVETSLQLYSAQYYGDMRNACKKSRDGGTLEDYERELLAQYKLCEEYTRIAPVYSDSISSELFRGIRKKPYDPSYFNWLLSLKLGDTFDLEKMPTSFSTNSQKAKDFANSKGIIIHIPRNKITNAPSIRGISLNPTEDEVLVADYNWKIKAISDQRVTGDGFYHITLDINNS